MFSIKLNIILPKMRSIMESKDFENIPADIKAALNEIAERLWSSHAAVMVGAGFSKNAHKANASAPDFPNWHELGDRFYEKLHSQTPDVNTPHYLNPLKLADEIQAAFGRPALDQELRTHIPDKGYEPSDLHIGLLELPWVDVFTVNYDTLLERASSKITTRRFDVVVNKEDLVYSTRPRIIKLHGSFPSSLPFVISEDDYRRYPKEQAPFVNTVQQALLENTLCLLGFSGDDPNFLHWIGWVKDNLGKENSPKMYLLGILSLSTAQRKLLEERNIVLVDMAQCLGVGRDHQKAFSIVFSYLKSRKPAISLDWPRHTSGASAIETTNVEEILQNWKKDRETYPNWIVAPKNSRKTLLRTMQGSYLDQISQIPSPQDILFISELNWRFEHALFPIPNNFASQYERILGKYNPYPQNIEIESAEFNPKTFPDFNWGTIGVSWLGLCLALLRLYREEGLRDKWKLMNARLETLKTLMGPENLAKFHYERCLNALFAFDLKEMKDSLENWPINYSLPFWEVKRAGLLAELGETTEAGNILEEALSAIRSNQQLSPVISDFTWVSQESHAMHLLSSVNLLKPLVQNKQNKENGERWNELKKYKCDPWGDMEYFDIKLKAPLTLPFSVTRKKKFDIGREAVSHHIGSGVNEDLLLGYSFLRYCEEVGLPFINMAPDQAKRAADRISDFASTWAMTTLLRIGRDEIDSVFGRKALARMNVAKVDALVMQFIEIFRKNQTTAQAGGHFFNRTLGTRIANVIPEVLSRLCPKCSYKQREEIFKVLKWLYENQLQTNFDGVENLVSRLFGSWTKKEQCVHFHELLEFPLLETEHEYPEPFRLLTFDNKFIEALNLPPVKHEIIESLLSKMCSKNREERSRASIRLVRLYECHLLNKTQASEFGSLLWSQVGQDGFPVNLPFYKWAYVTWPAPKEINIKETFKLYIKNASFLGIDSASNSGITITELGKAPVQITGGRIRLAEEILCAIPGDLRKSVDWSTEEISVLLEKLISWWDSGKEYLRTPSAPSIFGGIHEEFAARYSNLVKLLVEVVAPGFAKSITEKDKVRLRILLNELDAYGMPSLPAWAACLSIFPEEESKIYSCINSLLVVGDSEQADSAT